MFKEWGGLEYTRPPILLVINGVSAFSKIYQRTCLANLKNGKFYAIKKLNHANFSKHSFGGTRHFRLVDENQLVNQNQVNI